MKKRQPDHPLWQLNMSVITTDRILSRFDTIRELEAASGSLEMVPNIGPVRAGEIRQALARWKERRAHEIYIPADMLETDEKRERLREAVRDYFGEDLQLALHGPVRDEKGREEYVLIVHAESVSDIFHLARHWEQVR